MGINTRSSSRSGGSHGIGFAIPATMVRAVVASAEAGADRVPRRPWPRRDLQALSPDPRRGVGLLCRPRRRASSTDVARPKGPAAHEAGLARGDVVLASTAASLSSITEAFGYRFALAGVLGVASGRGAHGAAPGRDPRRSGAADVPAGGPATRSRLLVEARSPLDGASVVNLSPAVADEMRILQGRRLGRRLRRCPPARSPPATAFAPATCCSRSTRVAIERTTDVEGVSLAPRPRRLGAHHPPRRPPDHDRAAGVRRRLGRTRT